MADPDRLAQLTANLIENALRYAAHEVRVTARRGRGSSELWVIDDGPGIAPDDLGRVFERLFVARPRPDRPVGSGLGLAIVAELTAAMGGTVRAESPLNSAGGTRMVVTLRGAPVAAHENLATGLSQRLEPLAAGAAKELVLDVRSTWPSRTLDGSGGEVAVPEQAGRPPPRLQLARDGRRSVRRRRTPEPRFPSDGRVSTGPRLVGSP